MTAIEREPFAKPTQTLDMDDAEWFVDACSCGFDGGDCRTGFRTEAEAREWAEYLDENSDSTVYGVWPVAVPTSTDA